MSKSQNKPSDWPVDKNGKPVRRRSIGNGVYQRPDRKYEIGFHDSTGKQRWQGPFDRTTDARTALADVQARKGKGEKVAPNPRLTFGEAGERWLESQAKNRPNTRDKYESHLRVHLLPRWQRTRLDRIDVDQLAAFADELTAAGKSPNTADSILRVAKHVFDFAGRRLGYAGRNPYDLLERSEKPGREPVREKIVLSAEQRALLVGHAEPLYRPIFEFANATGLRISEALAATWGAIDLFDGTFSVERQLARDGELDRTLKTPGSRNQLDLPDALIASLAARKEALGAEPADDDPVFLNARGVPFAHGPVQRALKRAGKAAGIKGRLTFHVFRRSHGSGMIAAGADLLEVAAALRDNPNTVARHYLRDIEDVQRRTQRRARLNRIYGSAVEAADRNTSQQTAAGQTQEPA